MADNRFNGGDEGEKAVRKLDRLKIWLLVGLVGLVGAGFMPAATHPVTAGLTRWDGPDGGSWFSRSNWDNGIPGEGDAGVIANGGIARFGAGEAVTGELVLGEGPGTSGGIRQRDGQLHAEELRLGVEEGASGYYRLDRGYLSGWACRVGVFGSGSMTNRGGLHLLEGALSVGNRTTGDGVYALDGNAALMASTIDVGREGRGSLILEGGVVWPRPDHLGPTLSLAERGGEGRVELHDDAEIRLNILRLRGGGEGVFRQAGGTMTVGGMIEMEPFAEATALYRLEGGVLRTDDLFMKGAGEAVFLQTGGEHRARQVIVGDARGRGRYTMEGGSLVAETLIVSGPDPGRFELGSPDADVTVSERLVIGPEAELAAVAGARLEVSGGSVEIESQSPARLTGLADLQMILSGSEGVELEAAGEPDEDPEESIEIGDLQVGDGGAVQARLVDRVDNTGDRMTGDETLIVGRLGLGADSELDVSGLGLHARTRLELSEGSLLLADGRLTAPKGLFASGAFTLVGGGSIDGPVTQAATMRVEASNPLTLNGDYHQEPEGRLTVRAGSEPAPRSQAPLTVHGTAHLAGTLDVGLDPDHEPTAGDYFTIVSYDRRVGEVDSLELPSLPDGLDWRVEYQPDRLVIAPAEEGEPEILVPPEGRSVLEGESVTFRVLAVGRPEPTFQWLFEGEPVAGATDSTLPIAEASFSDAGAYQVRVTNSHGSVTSEAVTLDVETAARPSITEQPSDQRAFANENVVLEVTAEGAPEPDYQWRFNGEDLAGETEPRLFLTNVNEDDVGRYTVRVSNAVDSVISREAELTLFPLSAIPTVRVGDADNPPDPRPSIDDTTHGAVERPYRIGRHEINHYQYAAFLNAVARLDAYDLFRDDDVLDEYQGIMRHGQPGEYHYEVKEGMGLKPVVYVSFFDAVRFVNWLHNGRPEGPQGIGTTEAGAYRLTNPRREGREDQWIADVSERQPGARWFLPSEDEWYKAAYYDPDRQENDGYWRYATRSSEAPAPVPPPGGTNAANYDRLGEHNAPGVLTEVGAYPLSRSAYGTFDQNGNVSEWTQTLSALRRVVRGGHMTSGAEALRSDFRSTMNRPREESLTLGFRVGRRAEDHPPLEPEIAIEPFDQAALLGGEVTFVVQATGVPDPDYQWRLNGEPVAGANDPMLRLESVSLDDAGAYQVEIENRVGSVASRIVRLDVVEPGGDVAVWRSKTDGAWSEPANWADRVLPTSEDWVLLHQPQAPTEVTFGGVHRVRRLTSNEAFTLQGGELSVRETVRVNERFHIKGGALVDATVVPGGLSGDRVLFHGARPATLRRVTMRATMDVSTGSGDSRTDVRLQEGMTLESVLDIGADGRLIADGDQELRGDGMIRMGTSGRGIALTEGTEWTVGPQIEIEGGVEEANREPSEAGRLGAYAVPNGGPNALINQGRIRSDRPNGLLTMAADHFLNEGRLEAGPEAAFAVESTWTNRGDVVAEPGSTLKLGGDRAGSEARPWANHGTIEAAEARVDIGGTYVPADPDERGEWAMVDSELNLVGTVDNRDRTFVLSQGGGDWLFRGGTIEGGRVESEPGARLVGLPKAVSNEETPWNVLEEVTWDANLDLQGNEAYVEVIGALTIHGRVGMGASSTMDASQGEVVVGPDGQITGGGTIAGPVTNAGRIRPGHVLGRMIIEGDLVQTSSGRMVFDLAGTRRIVDYGTIRVDQAADLQGEVVVRLQDGFSPEAGDSFRLLRYDTRAGSFDSFDLPDLGPELLWEPEVGSNELRLHVRESTDEMNQAEESPSADPDSPAGEGDIRQAFVQDDRLVLIVQTDPGRAYQVEEARRAANPDWTAVGEVQVADDRVTELRIPVPNRSMTIYRVVAQPTPNGR